MRLVLSWALILLLSGGIERAWAVGRELSDAELDEITAGGMSLEVVDNGQLAFQFAAGGGAIPIDGSGTISAGNGSLLSSIGTVILTGSAQSNLQSLVNITAISSAVQVLINLNVNIQSTVGSVRQFNGVPRF